MCNLCVFSTTYLSWNNSINHKLTFKETFNFKKKKNIKHIFFKTKNDHDVMFY